MAKHDRIKKPWTKPTIREVDLTTDLRELLAPGPAKPDENTPRKR